MDMPRALIANARTVMAQMAVAFEHFNEVHPHSALKMKSPREFRQHRAAQQRIAQIEPALHCE
jgi:transposase InsO family protein